MATVDIPEAIEETNDQAVQVDANISDTTIPVEALDAQALTIPDTSFDDPLSIDSIISGSQSAQGRFDTDAKKFESEEDDLNISIKTLMNDISGKGQETIDLEKDAGIADTRKQLQDLLGTINQKTSALDKGKIQDERLVNALEGQGKSVPLDIVRGKQVRLAREQSFQRRAEAAEIGALTATAQLLQGNIRQAQETIDRAISLKYGDIEQDLENELFFLKEVQSKGTEARRNSAKERERIIDLRLSQVKEAKNNERAVFDFMGAAASKGADQETLERIGNASTWQEAARIANQFIGSQARADNASNANGGSVGPDGLSDIEWAQELALLNPDAPDAELIPAMIDRGLTKTEAQVVINNRFSTDDLQFEAEELVTDFFDPKFFSGRGSEVAEAKKKALDDIDEGGVISIDDKQVRLTPAIQERLRKAVNEVSQETIETIRKARKDKK